MPASPHQSEPAPGSDAVDSLEAVAGASARTRLEDAVGRELAVRLVSALSGPQRRDGDSTP
jgi:hypothetical protein